jgi:ketosteroid isomerase-like protein
MKRRLSIVLVGLSVVLATACQPGAAGLSEQDKVAIRKTTEDALKLANVPKPDWAAYAKLYYAEDATVLAANMPPTKGMAAIQTLLQAFPPTSEFKVEILDLDGRGDLAYVRGAYSMTLSPTGAPPVTDRGNYVEVWKRQVDGSWKVVYDSWSSELPVPGVVVPTGAMTADATPELKKLGDMVGRWRMDGTFKPDPKAAAGPVDLVYSCDWFSGGRQVVYRFSGTMVGLPWEEVGFYRYDAAARAYIYDGITNDGTSGHGRVDIQAGAWVHTQDAVVDKKPAKVRFTLSSMTPSGGAWKYEVAVAGGPWAAMGEGKYTREK